MSDIVERLRANAAGEVRADEYWTTENGLFAKAADEIESLREKLAIYEKISRDMDEIFAQVK